MPIFATILRKEAQAEDSRITMGDDCLRVLPERDRFGYYGGRP